MKLIGTKEEIELILNALPRHKDRPPVRVDKLLNKKLIASYMGFPIEVEVVHDSMLS